MNRNLESAPAVRLCNSTDLANGERGLRFWLQRDGPPVPAFVVRYRGHVQAFVNRCAHKWVELDWEEGQFFDFTGQFLVCATHGALYEPDSGRCIAGPCRGASLTAVPVYEAEGGVWLAARPATVVK